MRIGLTTAPVLRRHARRHGVEMPITDGVCNVLGAGDRENWCQL
jgi:glycerol-3-phosphate dehydrogenase